MRFRHKSRGRARRPCCSRSPPWSASRSPAQAATSATATYAKTQDWGSGFEGKWTVKNTGTTAHQLLDRRVGLPLRHLRHLRLGRRRHLLRHPLDRQEQVLERHPRPRRLRHLRLQRRRLRLPGQLQAQRRRPATAARVPGDNAPSRPRHPHRLRHHRHLGEADLERGHRRQGHQELRRPARRRQGRHGHRHHRTPTPA